VFDFVPVRVEFMCLGLPLEIPVALGFQKVAVLSITKPKLYALSPFDLILIPMCDGWCQNTNQHMMAKSR